MAKKLNKDSVRYLKKKLDAVFSKYIRQRDKGICITCGVKKDPKQMQAGHYVPRQYNNTRFDECNVHCQCFACNCMMAGNLDEYALALKEKYHEHVLEELHAKKHTMKRWKPDELKELIKHYTKLVDK